LPPRPTEPVRYLFVDGGSLAKTMQAFSRQFWSDKKLEIDFVALGEGFKKKFYYDAYPVAREDQVPDLEAKIEAHDFLIDRVGTQPGWHAYAGEARYRRRQGGLEQKMVDIMIAVDMMRSAFDGVMDECTLLASDLDFKPLLDELVRQGMTVHLWYEPRATSRDLIRSADHARPFDLDTAYRLLTPASRAQVPALPDLSEHPDPVPAPDHPLIEEGSFHDGPWRLYEKPNGFLLHYGSPERRANYVALGTDKAFLFAYLAHHGWQRL